MSTAGFEGEGVVDDRRDEKDLVPLGSIPIMARPCRRKGEA
jgi:hypothetical protein